MKDLDLENCLVENFDGLQYCRNLTGFNYRLDEDYKDYGRRDFSFLQNLPELEEVSVAGNQVEDVSMCCGLASFDDLEEFKAMKIIFAAGNFESEEQMREYQEKYPHIEFDYELY